MTAFFHAILYVPIYNLLVFLIDHLPHGDVGLAVIIVTIIVSIIIMPLSISALRTTRAMKAIEPELNAIKEKYKDDKETQARETMELYRRYKVNPFASILTLIIQLPVLICLYWVFRTAALPAINASLLYSFVHAPAEVSTIFLGFFQILGHNWPLTIITGISQYFMAKYTIPSPPKPVEGAKGSMQDELGRAMSLQARYMLPLLIAFISYASGAIALYFITRNAVSIVQELYIRRAGLKQTPVKA
jgi:YidC/Oxa1 family membrane protein insertase